MTLKYSHTPGRIFAAKDGVVFFDTDFYPIQVDPTPIVLTGQTVTFPDLMKGIGYGFARGLRGSDMYRACYSIVTLGRQEWGPASSVSPPDVGRTLAETVLGTVPGSCDALYVQVKLTRTGNPSTINSNTIPTLFKEGEWVAAPGGSLPTEYLYPLSRQIDICLQVDANGAPVFNPDGTRNVVLQRRQSVVYKVYDFYRSDGDVMNTGWTGQGAAGRAGHLVYPIQQKGPNFTAGDGTDYAYGQGGQCSLVDPTNYSSVYTGDIKITPLYLDEPPDNSGAGDVAGYFAGHDVRSTTGVAAATFTDFAAGSPHPTRVVYAFVAGAIISSTNRTISQVKIGGVIAAPVLGPYDENNPNLDCGFYYASVPLGTSVDVEVTYAGGNVDRHYCSVWVTYNLTSPGTPFASLNSNLRSSNSSPNIAVTTTPGAVCLFGAAQLLDGIFPTTGGLQPGFIGPDEVTKLKTAHRGSPNTGFITGWAATHLATGTSLGVKAERDILTSGSTNVGLTQFRWMFLALV